MSKPEDIPQDVWDHAEVLANEATRDAMRDPLMPYFITVRPYFARAIMAERERCAHIAYCAYDRKTEICSRIVRKIRSGVER